MKHWGTITNVVGAGYGCVIYAQTVPTPPDSMPTTLIGAFIAISLGMTTTLGLVIKRLFEELRDSREKYTQSLEKVEKSANDRADKIATAVADGDKENREQLRREMEQQAELKDRYRQQQADENAKNKELLETILREIQRVRP